MKKLLATLAIVCFAASAVWAQVDPDPNGIGIFFDLEGSVVCETAGTGSTVFAYVAITNATAAGGISGWEAHVTMNPDPLPAGYYILGWTLYGDGLNLFAPPDFVVGMGSPLPWSPAIEVLQMQIGVFGAPACVEFGLRPADQPSHPGYMVYVDALDFTNIVDLQYSAGADYNAPAAMLNCVDCLVVQEETNTWGGVKALYQ
jgi:hypothetical protein